MRQSPGALVVPVLKRFPVTAEPTRPGAGLGDLCLVGLPMGRIDGQISPSRRNPLHATHVRHSGQEARGVLDESSLREEFPLDFKCT
jgi:hypothetical protein